jgi:hypothetical protein
MNPKRQGPLVSSIRSQKAIVAEVAHIYGDTAWAPNDRGLALEIVTELENRRVLYNDYQLEIPEWVVRSVDEMRGFFHEKLQFANRRESALANHLRAMRSACRKFLDAVGDDSGKIIITDSFHCGPEAWKFFTALGELRSTIGVTLGLLMAKYDLQCEPELVRILPAVSER